MPKLKARAINYEAPRLSKIELWGTKDSKNPKYILWQYWTNTQKHPLQIVNM
jgi:hypothetical protein